MIQEDDLMAWTADLPDDNIISALIDNRERQGRQEGSSFAKVVGKYYKPPIIESVVREFYKQSG